MKSNRLSKITVAVLILLLLPPVHMTNACEKPVSGMSESIKRYTNLKEASYNVTGYDSYVEFYSSFYGVDADLVKAVILTESGGDRDAKNLNDDGTYDTGLMQINSFNHDWLRNELRITDFSDPLQNIHCGVFMLSDLMARHSKYHDILMCYNAGENKVRELHKKGIYSTLYSRTVMKQYNSLKKAAADSRPSRSQSTKKGKYSNGQYEKHSAGSKR